MTTKITEYNQDVIATNIKKVANYKIKLQHVLDADPSNEMVKHVLVSVLRSIHNDSIRRIARNHDEPNLLHLGRILVQ